MNNRNAYESPCQIKIWIDLDNTPHVPFFRPIIRELKNKGYHVAITARDAFQVCELSDKLNVPYLKIGRHYGKNRIMKILGLMWRSAQLIPFFIEQKPDLVLSHGARSANFLCNLLGRPTIVCNDYEYSRGIPLAGARWVIEPEALRYKQSNPKGYHYYRGIKEDVYVPDFIPDSAILRKWNYRPQEIIVLVRPPAVEAHYFNDDSMSLFLELMKRICQTQNARAILLPRNKHQHANLKRNYAHWFQDDKVLVPSSAEDGLNLIWHSDLVVGGGGTMNREAAALGVPVYSIFRGKSGAVDLMLEKEGRLRMIRNLEEIWTKILLAHREKPNSVKSIQRPALEDILDIIENILRIERILL